MAVNDVRAEFNRRKDRECRFAEKCKTSDIIRHPRICLVAGEEVLIVDKIEVYSFVYALHYADIVAVPVEVHVEMRLVLHEILPLLVNEGIHGNDDTAVIIFLVKDLRKRTDNVRKSSGLYERNTLGCNKKNIFHLFQPPWLSNLLILN